MIPPVSRREAFTVGCLRRLGDVVVWGGMDCSELVAVGEIAAGLPDRRRIRTAQGYADANLDAPESAPMLGDLGFFGRDWNIVVHVVVSSFGRQILSADGATGAIRDVQTAAKIPGARVRLHQDLLWYRTAPWLGWRRHQELDI